uniref:G-protein coupled receptors family 1 profile domain-containing protein n=1 Tax=Molossus molossus TaxID=27622 RepID=A0A7J8C938_MOLMO|nr:hypothetical protein HJG59_010003 [Molossus molossus]
MCLICLVGIGQLPVVKMPCPPAAPVSCRHRRLGLVSLVENVLVVAAIAKNQNLHTPTYFFTCGLAVSDLLASVSTSASWLPLLCQYPSVFYALQYHSIVTLPWARWAIAATWVASVISSTPFFAYYDRTAILLCLVSVFVATLVLTSTPSCIIICNAIVDPPIYAFRSQELQETGATVLVRTVPSAPGRDAGQRGGEEGQALLHTCSGPPPGSLFLQHYQSW